MPDMALLLRLIQVAALCVGVAAFAGLAYSDPIPPTRAVLVIGCALFGFGLMFAITYLMTLLLHGRQAARTLEWY